MRAFTHVRRACVLGQLIRGIRFGDRRSAHMRSSGFADRSRKRPATIRFGPIRLPLGIRELELYRGQGVDYALLASHRLPTWNAYSGILVSIVACIWGGSFNRCGIYGFRSVILHACVLACRSTAPLFLRSIPPGSSDMATRVTAPTASLKCFGGSTMIRTAPAAPLPTLGS